MKPVSVHTPAKLNLGLEIVRRRSDGYHDLVTIFQAIDLYDRFEARPDSKLTYSGDPGIPSELDIARRALFAFAAERGWTGRIRLRKSIPIAAGLGGGSSDAALIVRLATLDEQEIDDIELARSIGADVRFFLRAGTALGFGIGDRLEPIQTPGWCFVISVPALQIERKTAALFSGLARSDFSDGAATRALASVIDAGAEAFPLELPNAFERQMLEYAAVARCWDALGKRAGRVALSGAGPAVFSWHTSEEEAEYVAAAVRAETRAEVLLARAVGPHSDESSLRAFKRVLESHAEGRISQP